MNLDFNILTITKICSQENDTIIGDQCCLDVFVGLNP